jgi:hypothetical protein
MDERQKLAAEIGDADLIDYFYLDVPAAELVRRLDAIRISLTESQDAVPFNAQVKGYIGSVDGKGHPWILKPALNDRDIVYHRLCGLAYLIDHVLGTMAAPTTLVRIDGKPFRATKVVRNAVQISSCDYLDKPFIDILRADLVNRWLFFDEDRNPNNYLVIHNKANKPFVVAIDYDKADLEAEHMKITGNPDKFGWFRKEKTRFLTLLRPDHFEGIGIEVFDARLKALMAIPEAEIHEIALALLSGYAPDAPDLANRVTSNLLARRAYIDKYFRSMFKPASQVEDIGHEADYSMFGSSFVNMYKDKR